MLFLSFLIPKKQMGLSSESIKMYLSDNKVYYCSNSYSLDTIKLGTTILKTIPHLKFLRMILRKNLVGEKAEQFAKALNQLTHLREVELYSDVGYYNANQKDWSGKLSSKIKAKRVQYQLKAKVIAKEGLSFSKQILMQMETMNHQKQTDLYPVIVAELPKVKEWKCLYLTCRNRFRDNVQGKELLKEISHINLSELRILELYACMVHSIQPLATMRIPKLRQLYLVRNHIVSIRLLIKMHCPDLNTLQLQINTFEDSAKLPEGNWKKLEEISVGMDMMSNSENFQFLSKLILSRRRQRVEVTVTNKLNHTKFLKTIGNRQEHGLKVKIPSFLKF